MYILQFYIFGERKIAFILLLLLAGLPLVYPAAAIVTVSPAPALSLSSEASRGLAGPLQSGSHPNKTQQALVDLFRI